MAGSVTFDATVLTAVQQAQAAGITVLGYVYSDYGKRSLSAIEADMQFAHTNYGVNGIFIDNGTTSCTASNSQSGTEYAYYQTLIDIIHGWGSGEIAVLNPGTQPPTDCWMNLTDIIMNAEDKGLTAYQNDKPYPWVFNYPATRFWNIVYDVSSTSDMESAVTLSKSRNAGYVYVTAIKGGNPYDFIPSYWLTEVSFVN
jgi:hypothetical protein